MSSETGGQWLFEAIAPTIGDEAIGVGGIQCLLRARRNREKIVVFSKAIRRFERNFDEEDLEFRDGEIRLFAGGGPRLLLRSWSYFLLALAILSRSRSLAFALWSWCPSCNREALRAVESASCVFFQGGPRWNREWLKTSSVLRRLFLLVFLKTTGIRIVQLGVSAGPFSESGLRERVITFAAIRCLRACTAVVVRDDRSMKELEAHLAGRLFRAPDYALGLEPDGEANDGLIPGKAVCLNLRVVPERYGIPEQRVREKAALLAAEVTQWARKRGRIVYFLSMNDFLAVEKDSACLQWLNGASKGMEVIDRDLTSREVRGLLQGFEAIISVRMHPVILGVSAGVPSVALGYARKSRMFMESIGMDEFNFELEDLEAGDIRRVLRHIEERRESIADALQQESGKMRSVLCEVTGKVIDLVCTPA